MSTISKYKRVRLRTLLIGAICAAAILLYPFKSTVCPAWRIQIVDAEGNSVRDVFVRQHWQDYSVESNGHEQDTHSDENGYVDFPERTIRANILSRFMGATLNVLLQGIHASFGASAHIAAYGDMVKGRRLEGYADYKQGQPLPAQIKMHIMNLY